MDIFKYKHAASKPLLPFRTEPRRNVRAKGVINFTVPDARKLQERDIFSEPITVRKLLWRIKAGQEINNESATLDVYLSCSGCAKSTSWACQVNAKLCLLPWKAETAPVTKELSKLFDKDSRAWGFSFISMEWLLDPMTGYVNPTDFSLKLQIQMSADLPAGMECL
ncbi:ubiquitin carboxyl-terminal hydrolase 7-like [Paramacrobiotus metropolitanus]|uniref:ubiquitin carboxyl-terminal hydrolase 7-like n=1 Tax=Paramacrobiotus metropolitanus TaxID=2943436 RepID=UPI0024458D55|nr:ubiquitin carboxyl-terminal hydrolase 7-like [Paramacrobiotus metropolitanus]